MTPAEMRQKAQDWYDRQVAVIAQSHGSSWPTHQEWIDAYLKEEIRQRLLELGWRPR